MFPSAPILVEYEEKLLAKEELHKVLMAKHAEVIAEKSATIRAIYPKKKTAVMCASTSSISIPPAVPLLSKKNKLEIASSSSDSDNDDDERSQATKSVHTTDSSEDSEDSDHEGSGVGAKGGWEHNTAAAVGSLLNSYDLKSAVGTSKPKKVLDRSPDEFELDCIDGNLVLKQSLPDERRDTTNDDDGEMRAFDSRRRRSVGGKVGGKAHKNKKPAATSPKSSGNKKRKKENCESGVSKISRSEGNSTIKPKKDTEGVLNGDMILAYTKMPSECKIGKPRREIARQSISLHEDFKNFLSDHMLTEVFKDCVFEYNLVVYCTKARAAAGVKDTEKMSIDWAEVIFLIGNEIRMKLDRVHNDLQNKMKIENENLTNERHRLSKIVSVNCSEEAQKKQSEMTESLSKLCEQLNLNAEGLEKIYKSANRKVTVLVSIITNRVLMVWAKIFGYSDLIHFADDSDKVAMEMSYFQMLQKTTTTSGMDVENQSTDDLFNYERNGDEGDENDLASRFCTTRIDGTEAPSSPLVSSGGENSMDVIASSSSPDLLVGGHEEETLNLTLERCGRKFDAAKIPRSISTLFSLMQVTENDVNYMKDMIIVMNNKPRANLTPKNKAEVDECMKIFNAKMAKSVARKAEDKAKREQQAEEKKLAKSNGVVVSPTSIASVDESEVEIVKKNAGAGAIPVSSEFPKKKSASGTDATKEGSAPANFVKILLGKVISQLVMSAKAINNVMGLRFTLHSTSAKNKNELLLFLLEHKKSSSDELLALFKESELFDKIRCQFLLPYQDTDYQNTSPNGWCVYTVWLLTNYRAQNGYATTLEEMIGKDRSLLQRTHENCKEFSASLNKLVSALGGAKYDKVSRLGHKERVDKAKVFYSIPAKFMRNLDQMYYADSAWLGYGDCTCFNSNINYGSKNEGYAVMSVSSWIEKLKPNNTELPGLLCATFAEVAEVVVHPPNYCVFSDKHCFVVESPAQSDIQANYDLLIVELFDEISRNVNNFSDMWDLAVNEVTEDSTESPAAADEELCLFSVLSGAISGNAAKFTDLSGKLLLRAWNLMDTVQTASNKKHIDVVVDLNTVNDLNDVAEEVMCCICHNVLTAI